MNNFTDTTAAAPAPFPAPGALTWRRRWCCALIDSYGCNGPDAPEWVAFDTPTTLGAVQHARRQLRSVRSTAELVVGREHPAPVYPKRDDWDATMGEYFDAHDAAAAAATSSRAAKERAVTEAIASHWARAGAKFITFGCPPPSDEYDPDDGLAPGVAIAAVDEHGCRCGHGARGFDPADAGVEVPPMWFAELSPGRHLVAPGEDLPDGDAVNAALADAAAAHSAVLDDAAAEHTLAVQATQRSEEAIRAMDAATYREHDKHLPRGASGRGPSAPPTFDVEAAQVTGDRAAAQALRGQGLYLATAAD